MATVERSLKALRITMKKDKRYKRMRESFDRLPMFQLPIESLIKEVETLHKMREIRRLNTEDTGFVDSLIKANTSDQAIRGRLTEVIMACVRGASQLEKATRALRNHLLFTFTSELRSYRTKEERQQVVEMVLVPFRDYIDQISVLKEITELVVTDIDKGAWSLKLTTSALELHGRRESNI